MPYTLITGPSRSGKSEWAEHLATLTGQAVTYVATSQADPADAEWSDRLARHRQRRPSAWCTLELPADPQQALDYLTQTLQQSGDSDCLLIDSLGTWLAGLLELDEAAWLQQQQTVLDGLSQSRAQVFVVGEEVGWGVVPVYPLGRVFRDRLGSLIRRLTPKAQAVYLVSAGYALNLKVLGVPVPESTEFLKLSDPTAPELGS